MPLRAEYHSIFWACVSSWYYGYHISEMNFPVASLTCSTSVDHTFLSNCLGLDSNLYGVITATSTVGGFFGSLVSSRVSRRHGLTGGLVWTGWINLLSVILMASAPHWVLLALGRLIAGIASGLAICLVPPYLNLTARSSPALAARSGQIGTFHQLAIVLGICSAQIMGLIATGEKGDIPGNWRYVVALTGAVSMIQISTSRGMLAPKTGVALPPATSVRLEDEEQLDDGNEVDISDEAATSLLPPAEIAQPTTVHSRPHQLSLKEILGDPALFPPTLMCIALMVVQEMSGINAVMYYSTPVLRPLLPTSAGVVGIGITVVNALMTLPAVFLVDRVGRKTLLLSSITGMAIASMALATGLNDHYQHLSAISIVAFVAAFATGLGPIPLVLVAELVPPPAMPAVSSLSLSINWLTAFLIALLFLPLRDALSSPDSGESDGTGRSGEGRVFYLFTAILIAGGLVVWRGLKGR